MNYWQTLVRRVEPLQSQHPGRKPRNDGVYLKHLLTRSRRLLMFVNSTLTQSSNQLMLRRFGGDIVQHQVGRDEFCKLLLSRRPLERCNDVAAHRCGLFDPRSGDLYNISESALHASA